MARAPRSGAEWLIPGLFAVTCLVVVVALILRARDEVAFKHLHAKLVAGRARYLAGEWRRPSRGVRRRECNALREVREVLDSLPAARARSEAGSSTELDRVLSALRQSLECSAAFWPEGFAAHPVADLDFALHAKASAELLARAKQAEPRACLALALDGIALGYDLASGAGAFRASIAYDEIRGSASFALGCIQRAAPEDVDAVVSQYQEFAAVVPPLQWTYVYQYLCDAEFEDRLFFGRPWLPRFWHPSAYYLTAGSRILPRLAQALSAAERAASVIPEQPGFVAKLEGIQRDLSPLMGGTLATGITASKSEQASVFVRAVTCALSSLARNPTMTAAIACGPTSTDPRALRFVREGPAVRCYWFGENGRDDAGRGDDIGVQFRLERASEFPDTPR